MPLRRIPIWRHALVTICSLAAVTACAWLQIPVSSGGVLFQDDFSRSSSGWDRYRDSAYSSDYTDGVYRIEVNQAGTDAWANPGLDFGDVRIEVDATKAAGPDNNVFGVLCRYQDPLNYYFLLVSSDGYVGIGVHKAGQTTLLSSESMLPNSAVLQGSSKNHLRADCVGNQLRLYANGSPVAEARAFEWSRGDVGLMAGAYDEPGVVIEFDNFSALLP